MFTIKDHRRAHNCQGYSRREFLKIGSLGLGGFALPQLLAHRAQAAMDGRPVTGKSVVFLFLQGGPPHIELFDPKMTAPSEIRSITGEVKTRLPGITFGGTFPKLAAIADKLALVRSYASGNSSHTYMKVASGGNSLEATMGALYSRAVGNNHPRTGMPSNILLKPEAVQPGIKMGENFETKALPTLTAPGKLGAAYSAFDPSGSGTLQQDMELSISPDRFQDRRYLLSHLDRMKRSFDQPGVIDTTDKFQQQAFDIITRGVAAAFDLSKEDPRTIERYDTSKLFDIKESQRWFDMRRSTNLLGRQLLLARRLCEAGCGFVTVSDCGWDFHANKNSPKNMAGIHWLGNQVDHAVAAFVQDVRQRGLADKILLVVTGEMGRSPKINKNGGREHYGELTSLLFAGGGLRMGQVIGQSDEQASKPATKPYGPKEMLATIMHTLFDVGQVRVSRSISPDVVKVIDGGPTIRELF